MKSHVNIILLSVIAALLVACSSNKTVPEETPVAVVAPPVVVETAPAPPALRADQTFIGGSSLANGGAIVDMADTILYFDFDMSTLTAPTRASLTRIAAALRTSTGKLRLEGHADERGTREYNIALGERRAKAVYDFLVLQGVSGSRMEAISYGEERPAVTGTGEAAWSKNRRVEIK